MSSWSRPTGPQAVWVETVTPVRLVRPGSSSEDPLLHGRDPVQLRSDLSDDASPDVGAFDALRQLRDYLLSYLVRLRPPQVGLVVLFPVPAGPQHDIQPRTFRHLPYAFGVLDREQELVVASQAPVRLVDYGNAARLLVQHQLPVGQLRIIEEAVHGPLVAHHVQEDVLVDQREAEVAGLHGTCDRHDGWQANNLRVSGPRAWI